MREPVKTVQAEEIVRKCRITKAVTDGQVLPDSKVLSKDVCHSEVPAKPYETSIFTEKNGFFSRKLTDDNWTEGKQ